MRSSRSKAEDEEDEDEEDEDEDEEEEEEDGRPGGAGGSSSRMIVSPADSASERELDAPILDRGTKRLVDQQLQLFALGFGLHPFPKSA